MFNDQQKEKLRKLIDAWCEGSLTEEQANRLQQWVCQDDDACRYFLDYMELNGLLVLEHAEENLVDSLVGVMAETADSTECLLGKSKTTKSPILGFLGDVFQAGASFLSRSFVLTFLLAIGLPTVMLAILLVDLARQPVATAPREVASVVMLHEAVWEGENGQLVAGTALLPGQRLLLEDGLVELKYTNGTKVILQGPATFEVGMTTGGLLTKGMLTAQVPPPAHGFTIDTPTAKIVDLGTDFGVSVNDDGTVEAHVFEGEIEVETIQATEGKLPEKMRLKKGQAAKLARPRVGEAPRILAMASAPDRFVRQLSEPAISKQEPQSKYCFAHRGDADPLTEGWKILYRGKNAEVKQDIPALAPVNDGGIDAWMIDNRIPQKKISYHSNRKSEKGGLPQEMYELGKAKGWSLRARLKAEKPMERKSSSTDTSTYFWFNDGEKIWGVFIMCQSDGAQRVRISNKNGKGFNKTMPNSRDRYIEYEIRYHPATKDAEVFIDGKLVLPHFAGSINDGYKKTGERGIDFGLQTKKGKVKFALVEWKLLDEAPSSEQRRGN